MRVVVRHRSPYHHPRPALLGPQHEPPSDADARSNWLPAPGDQFALRVRAYVPTQALLDNS